MSKKAKSWSKPDIKFMALAFAEARKVKGKTLPNPAVGAVLVNAGKVIGKGGTRPAGQSHAEIVALGKAGQQAKGSTLYVTLEPCSHHGRTPPCVDSLIAAGIRKVVVAIQDANPLVRGKGIRTLRLAGIQVEVGLMSEEASHFYSGFFFRILHGRPKIILKIAQSLDGHINAKPGQETPITGEESRTQVHVLRTEVDAVLIGGRTLRIDNPDLTPRKVKGSVPEAIVLSRNGPFPLGARLFKKDRQANTVVVSKSDKGLPNWVDHVSLTSSRGKSSAAKAIEALFALFDQRGYHTVLVEGGPQIWALFLATGLWDTLFLVTAPKLLPKGESWDAVLPQDWGKSLKFRNFASFGKDFWAEFENSQAHG